LRFLVDAALSPKIAAALVSAGHDAVHLVDYGMLAAGDHEVLARAAKEDRIIVSADTDFAMILALGRESPPSLILFRHPVHAPSQQARRLIAELPGLEEALAEGSIVAIEEARVRVRTVPITD